MLQRWLWQLLLMLAINDKHDNAVLTIAGSDPSGGAGIQADIKTFTVLGVYGAAAITCLTAQNTMGVDSLLPVEPDFVKKQISLVLADLPITHIKTGMIGNVEIAKAINEALTDFTGEIICDPIIKASDGHDMMAAAEVNDLGRYIIDIATVLTPNLPELAKIANIEIKDQADIDQAAEILFSRFPKLIALIAKGGHGPRQDNRIIDTIYRRNHTPGHLTRESTTHPFIDSQNTHGTGCTFAAAFTAHHCKHNDYTAAFHSSIHFMDSLMTLGAEKKMGHGHGPLFHHLAINR